MDKERIERLREYFMKQNPQTIEMQCFKKGYLQAIYDILSIWDDN